MTIFKQRDVPDILREWARNNDLTHDVAASLLGVSPCLFTSSRRGNGKMGMVQRYTYVRLYDRSISGLTLLRPQEPNRGGTLRAWKANHGLSHPQAAAALGVPPGTARRWLAGQSQPRSDAWAAAVEHAAAAGFPFEPPEELEPADPPEGTPVTPLHVRPDEILWTKMGVLPDLLQCMICDFWMPYDRFRLVPKYISLPSRSNRSRSCLDCEDAIPFSRAAGAKKRGYEYRLTDDHVSAIRDISDKCQCCGSEFEDETAKRGMAFSVDRVSNSVGYTPLNCAPICRHCNSIKSSRSIEGVLRGAKVWPPLAEYVRRFLYHPNRVTLAYRQQYEAHAERDQLASHPTTR